MSKLIGILPSRGGVGATTVALHLTHALQRTGAKVTLAAGGHQAQDLDLLRPGLSFLDDDVRLELTPTMGIDQVIALADGDIVFADLPVGYVPGESAYSALVVVVQARPTSLSAAWESLAVWEGNCPLYLLVNGSPWPMEGQMVARRLVTACAANGSVQVEALPSLDQSLLLSRSVVSGKTAFDLAPYMPVAKTVKRLAAILTEDVGETKQVDLGELRSERAA
jgi:MinD-like ATPase involved in chromosome partitioning or flagellar assembly